MARVQSAGAFAAELLMSAAEVPVLSSRVVKSAAQSIKAQARANVLASAPTHNAGAHRAITYDEPSLVGVRISTEVGYDKDLPGGAIGNLLEYGGGGDKSPAHRDIGRAADDEEARFADAMRLMTRRLL